MYNSIISLTFAVCGIIAIHSVELKADSFDDEPKSSLLDKSKAKTLTGKSDRYNYQTIHDSQELQENLDKLGVHVEGKAHGPIINILDVKNAKIIERTQKHNSQSKKSPDFSEHDINLGVRIGSDATGSRIVNDVTIRNTTIDTEQHVNTGIVINGGVSNSNISNTVKIQDSTLGE